MSTSKTKKNTWIRLLPGLIVSALALAAVFYFVDLADLAKALQVADYRFVVLTIGITLVWLSVRALAWRTLLQEKATFMQAFLTLNEGYLLNNILPFRLGELGRAYLMGRKSGLGFFPVFSTILIERSLDLAMAAGLLLCTLPFVVGVDWALQAAISAALLVMIGLGGLYLLARYRDWATAQYEKLSTRIKFLQKLDKQLSAFLSGLAVLTDGRRFLRAVGLIILNWLIAIFQYYALILAFFPNGKPLWAAFTLAAMALGIAAPSSPGAVGVLEAAVVGAMALFGQDASTALAMAITAHLTNYLLTGFLGIIGLTKDGLSLTGLYKDVQQITPEVETGIPPASPGGEDRPIQNE